MYKKNAGNIPVSSYSDQADQVEQIFIANKLVKAVCFVTRKIT